MDDWIELWNEHMESPRVKAVLQWQEEFSLWGWLAIDAGPGHSVFSDYNTDDDDIDYCLREARAMLWGTMEEAMDRCPIYSEMPFDTAYKVLVWTIEHLEKLKLLPEE